MFEGFTAIENSGGKMTCQVIRNEEGKATIILCSRGSMQVCITCGHKATLLCDYPLRGEKSGKTCDRPLCPKCTTKIPAPEIGHAQKEEMDLCPAHARIVVSKKE
jgi:hypothetical protein